MRLKEKDIINQLEYQENISPLRLEEIRPQVPRIGDLTVDAIIEFSIQNGPSFTAAVEFLSISTPKIIAEKINIFTNYASELKKQELAPMIIAPYIKRKESDLLAEKGISWIDMSGNMSINIPPSIYIERTGKPNKFPDSSPIKKIYEGSSSLVCRSLLLNPEGFTTLNEIVDFINNRNASITVGTVSKVLKSLEEELIISKTKSGISLDKPELLLNNLAKGYYDFSKRKIDRKFRYDVESIDALEALFKKIQIYYAYCGFYAAKRKNLAMTDQVTIFVKSIQNVRQAFKQNKLIATPDDEYGQVSIIEANNPCVWFNVQENTVDDLELYLEMVNDKPRGPKIAKQLKERILRKFNGK